MTRGSRIAVAAIGVAAWIVAAWALLPTAVPDGLSLPELNVDSVFGADVVAGAERYERLQLILWPLAQLAVLAVLVGYARWGAAYARESAGGRIATGMFLGMLGLGFAWLARLPFDLVSFWWAKRHDLTDTGWVEWVFGDYLQLGGTFLAVCLALVVVMGFAGWLGERWWLPGAAVVVGIAAALTLVAPYLTTDLRDFDRRLQSDAEQYEREQGVDGISYRIEQVGDETPLANAYAVGLGPTKRVVLWDTLLDGRFSDGAVRVVLAHEIAHHSSRHLLKGVAWFALFVFPAAWVLARVTRGRGGMARAEAVPLALLVIALIQLATAPATHWLSQRFEAEADWKALVSTEDPAGARDLFAGFAETALGDPQPPGWSHVLLDSHPTLAERVAMARAWARREGR